MKKSIYSIIIFVLSLLFLEGSLRLLGYSPTEFKQNIAWSPQIGYATDSLGINLKKGYYTVTINNCLKYSATHTIDGRRITSIVPNLPRKKNKIYIFGCSFAYGVGVNDQDTFPFLFQNKEKNYEVENYSVPGSGTIHAYLRLKKILENGGRPKIVVISYGTFHEERNWLTRGFESKLYDGIKFNQGFELTKYEYPRCTITNDSVEVKSINVIQDFQPVPFADKSAIATFVDQTWNQLDHKKTNELFISKLLMKKLDGLAKKFNFKLIIADISHNEKSDQIESFCTNNRLNYINISPDYSQGNYSLEPCDFHPNQEAHRIYAQKLYEYLQHN
jgi:lysophospholipase L1-like esterase